MSRSLTSYAAAHVACLALLAPAEAQSLLPKGDWGGSYWGLSAGGAWGSLKASDTSSSWVWTGFAGYGLQLSALYLGGELDTTLGGARNLSRVSPPSAVASEVDWSLSGRARIGIAHEGLLLYGTAGVAWARHRFETANLTPASSASEMVRGVVWGGGVELKLLPIVSGRLEALHYDYAGTETSFSRSLRSSLSGAIGKGIAADETVFRAGLVIRWN